MNATQATAQYVPAAQRPLPRAWRGFAEGYESAGFVCVSVCAWCPDKAEADKLAASSGFEVSHGICPECLAKQRASLRITPA